MFSPETSASKSKDIGGKASPGLQDEPLDVFHAACRLSFWSLPTAVASDLLQDVLFVSLVLLCLLHVSTASVFIRTPYILLTASMTRHNRPRSAWCTIKLFGSIFWQAKAQHCKHSWGCECSQEQFSIMKSTKMSLNTRTTVLVLHWGRIIAICVVIVPTMPSQNFRYRTGKGSV